MEVEVEVEELPPPEEEIKDEETKDETINEEITPVIKSDTIDKETEFNIIFVIIFVTTLVVIGCGGCLFFKRKTKRNKTN